VPIRAAANRPRSCLAAFLEELRAKRYSSSLERQSSWSLAWLFSHLREEGVRDLRDAREAHLVSFARVLRQAPRGTPLSAATQSLYLQRVRSFFAFLVRRGLLLTSPAADLTLPVSSPLPRTVLSERQAEKLMSAPPAWTKTGKRDRAILETFYGTGIRRGECGRLDVGDIDLRERTLLVRNGKGRKDRIVPLPARAALALDAYLRDVRPLLLKRSGEQALFLTAWWGKRLSEVSLSFQLRRHARAAGIPAVHPHALRHTCATHLLRGGADIRHVQEILGHRHVRTTAIYTRVQIEDLREVVRRCHPRERARRRAAPGLRMGVSWPRRQRTRSILTSPRTPR